MKKINAKQKLVQLGTNQPLIIKASEEDPGHEITLGEVICAHLMRTKGLDSNHSLLLWKLGKKLATADEVEIDDKEYKIIDFAMANNQIFPPFITGQTIAILENS